MNEHGPYIDAHGADAELVTRGGCIRLTDTGPVIHANSAHVASGIASAHIDPSDGWLWIVHDGSLPVVAVLCSPDETLAARGILIGASGGTTHSRVRFTRVTSTAVTPLDLRNPAHYAQVAGTNSNLWYAVVQMGTRTNGEPSRVDRLAAEVAALEARVAALEPEPEPPCGGGS